MSENLFAHGPFWNQLERETRFRLNHVPFAYCQHKPEWIGKDGRCNCCLKVVETPKVEQKEPNV